MVYQRKTPKKIVPEFPCSHCGKVFRSEMGFCAKCGFHLLKIRNFGKTGKTCLDCRSGRNDEWLASRELRAAKAAALELRMDEIRAYWNDPNRERSAEAKAYEAWCQTPEYRNRFVRGKNLGLDKDK